MGIMSLHLPTLEVTVGTHTLPIYMGADRGSLPKEEGAVLFVVPTGELHLSRALGAGEREAASRLIRLFGELEARRVDAAQLAKWQHDAEQAEGDHVPVAKLKIANKCRAKFQAIFSDTKRFLDMVPEADAALIRSDSGKPLVCRLDVPDAPGGKLVDLGLLTVSDDKLQLTHPNNLAADVAERRRDHRLALSADAHHTVWVAAEAPAPAPTKKRGRSK
ncbi:hypothetical protein WJX72_010190 [[Myrmecia] bisecta]|uniref:Uncharacterized protein n=1 Tax=[Myrmecia] bisecta TaxID=41462 RepID=A0AAW1QSF3_9CHLO